MPAAFWRIMPARSISRCETISASVGFSFRIGRKKRDNRMANTQGIGEGQERRSETGSGAKTQGQLYEKAAQLSLFAGSFPNCKGIGGFGTANLACPSFRRQRTSKSSSSVTFSKSVTNASIRMCQRPGSGSGTSAHMPVAVRAERGAALDRLDAALRQAQRQRRLLGGKRAGIAVHQLQHEIVRSDLARRNQHLEHRGLGVDVDRQRRLDRRRAERPRRRRKTPAGDDGENAERRRTHSSRTDRSQGPRIAVDRRARAGVKRKRFSAAAPSKIATSASLIQQDDAVSGLDQRAKAFELDDRRARRRPAPARRRSASRHAENRCSTGGSTSGRAAAPSPPGAPARRPRRRRRRHGGTATAGSAIAAARSRHGRWWPAKARRRPWRRW